MRTDQLEIFAKIKTKPSKKELKEKNAFELIDEKIMANHIKS